MRNVEGSLEVVVQAQFQALFEGNPNPVYLFDKQGSMCKANAAGRADVLADFASLFAASDQAKARRCFQAAWSGEVTTAELVCLQMGAALPLTVTLIPVIERGETVSLFMLTQHQLLSAELKALQENEQRYKSLFENHLNAVISLDLAGRYTSVNKACEQLSGYTAQELVGQHYTRLLPERQRPSSVQSFEQALAGHPQNHESLLLTKNGTCKEIELVKLPILVDGEIRGVYIIAKDITEEKKAKAMITHLAYHDTLTNLPNRALFRERLSTSLSLLAQHDQQLSVLFVDLDQLKYINDTVGHSAGDELLKHVATRLASCITDTDTLCRIGGDEFIILLPEIADEFTANRVAQNIIAVMQPPFHYHGQLYYVTCSVGIAIAPLHGKDPETLMQNADTAMYAAKERGKNTYQLYDSTLSQKIAARVELEAALRQAIEREEFLLHYQPQINSMTHEIEGAEALIRWNRPGKGMVSPADFIPLAEETDLIIAIGEWVFRKACEQVAIWRNMLLPPIRLSINLSTKQFQDRMFLGKVQKILTETATSPEWIGLEITESLIMKDVEYAIETLKQLRAMGFQISIDDFGTGYSSLGYLKKFPIDKLKIDQTFVQDLTHNEEDQAIIRTIIALAKNLGLKVVAEGVETAGHVAVLKKEDCDELQGYFFSKPLPTQDFTCYLQNWRND